MASLLELSKLHRAASKIGARCRARSAAISAHRNLMLGSESSRR
jgi:hypothetical protein